MLRVSVLLILAIALNAKLSVLVPNELASQFSTKNNTIPYSVANFGHIPWGRKLIGQVMLADPFDACQPVPPQTQFNQGEKPFVMVMRGNCSFVTKVRNSQLAGASLVIIMDNSIEPSDQVVMSDDGFGYTVQVPSVFIGEEDGELIAQFVAEQQQNAQSSSSEASAKVAKQVVMVMKFDTVVLDTTFVYFALTFQNRESFKLIREFAPHYEKLKNDDVVFDVFYDQITSPGGYEFNFTKPQVDCLGGGRYCQLDPDQEQPGTGRQVIEEELRQLCIFQVDKDRWWEYVPRFDRDCVLVQAWEDCSKKVMRTVGIDEMKVQQCVTSSFVYASGASRLVQNNTLLDKQREFKGSSGLRYYPGAIINNQSYMGALDANDIFGEVCNSMKKHTSYCQDYLDQEDYAQQSTQDSNIATIVIVVLLVLIVFFLFMVFIYRRMVRREMSREMSNQVNQMVSQYISFYEAKEAKEGRK